MPTNSPWLVSRVRRGGWTSRPARHLHALIRCRQWMIKGIIDTMEICVNGCGGRRLTIPRCGLPRKRLSSLYSLCTHPGSHFTATNFSSTSIPLPRPLLTQDDFHFLVGGVQTRGMIQFPPGGGDCPKTCQGVLLWLLSFGQTTRVNLHLLPVCVAVAFVDVLLLSYCNCFVHKRHKTVQSQSSIKIYGKVQLVRSSISLVPCGPSSWFPFEKLKC